MKYDYLMYYNDFFTKKISFLDFRTKLYSFFDSATVLQLDEFNSYIIDDQFTAYDADMVMLTYIAVWLYPNRFNKNIEIMTADNMYMGFLREVKLSYKDDFNKDLELIKQTLNYEIVKLGNIYIILNITEADIEIPLPSELQNGTHYCVNCNDEVDFEDSCELYPYGFYIIEK